jgi:hypothetical protein
MCAFEKKYFLSWIDQNPGFSSNEGICAQKIANFMQGIKSAKLEIANFSKGHIFGFSFLFPIM